MTADNGGSVSVWMRTKNDPNLHSLKANVHADVCVVGAGIAGLTTAYLLAREGKDVIVLDQNSVGSGETQRTTAHLSNAIDSGYAEIEKIHGEEGSRLVALSHTAAIDIIERISKDEKINCSFKRLDGYLFLSENDSPDLLEHELLAVHRAGLTSVTLCPTLPVPTLSKGPCLKYPNQGQFHPMEYLIGLAAAFTARGGKIYSEAQVNEIHGDGPVATVTTSGGQVVTSDAVVVATNTPINDRFVIHTKQAAYRTYALGFEVPKEYIPSALYWDTLDPYHYIRLHTEADREFLIVGGEDHRTGQSQDERTCYRRLENWANQHFNNLSKPEFCWSGQIEETIDGLAYIGRNPSDAPNIFVATGDSGMGMTHGTIAGRLLTDLIVKRHNPWSKLYEPSRTKAGGIKDWVKENANSVLQYKDHFTEGDLRPAEEIRRGEGAIVRHGLEKRAVYRDLKGESHSLSAICPHLGGVVRWNTAEKTWDCPCHGSRFSAEGSVIHGPAISGLPTIPVDENIQDEKKSYETLTYQMRGEVLVNLR